MPLSKTLFNLEETKTYQIKHYELNNYKYTIGQLNLNLTGVQNISVNDLISSSPCQNDSYFSNLLKVEEYAFVRNIISDLATQQNCTDHTCRIKLKYTSNIRFIPNEALVINTKIIKFTADTFYDLGKILPALLFETLEDLNSSSSGDTEYCLIIKLFKNQIVNRYQFVDCDTDLENLNYVCKSKIASAVALAKKLPSDVKRIVSEKDRTIIQSNQPFQTPIQAQNFCTNKSMLPLHTSLQPSSHQKLSADSDVFYVDNTIIPDTCEMKACSDETKWGSNLDPCDIQVENYISDFAGRKGFAFDGSLFFTASFKHTKYEFMPYDVHGLADQFSWNTRVYHNEINFYKADPILGWKFGGHKIRTLDTKFHNGINGENQDNSLMLVADNGEPPADDFFLIPIENNRFHLVKRQTGISSQDCLYSTTSYCMAPLYENNPDLNPRHFNDTTFDNIRFVSNPGGLRNNVTDIMVNPLVIRIVKSTQKWANINDHYIEAESYDGTIKYLTSTSGLDAKDLQELKSKKPKFYDFYDFENSNSWKYPEVLYLTSDKDKKILLKIENRNYVPGSTKEEETFSFSITFKNHVGNDEFNTHTSQPKSLVKIPETFEFAEVEKNLKTILIKNSMDLKSLPDRLIANLPHLEYFEVSQTSIDQIPDKFFDYKNHNLKYIKLSKNKLTTLPEKLLDHLWGDVDCVVLWGKERSIESSNI